MTALEWEMVRWWSTLTKQTCRQARKARTATRPTATLAETRWWMAVTCCPAWLSAEFIIVQIDSLLICLLSTFGEYSSFTSRLTSQGWAWVVSLATLDERERSGRLAKTGGGKVGGGGIGGGELAGFTANHSAIPPTSSTTAVVIAHTRYALQPIVDPVRQEGVEGHRLGVGWEERVLLFDDGCGQYLRLVDLEWQRRRRCS